MQPVTLTKSLYTRATKHRQFGNKEQVKTMVSITSCNPVVVSYQVHRKAAGKGTFWQDQAETKRSISPSFTKAYLINFLTGCSIREKGLLENGLKLVYCLKLKL